MTSALLQLENLTKVYGGGLFDRHRTVALEDFNLTLPNEPPRIITIAGESGSGKTTLANVVLGFLTPTAGRVLYDGQDIFQMSKRQWVDFRRQVQAVFQDPYGTYNPFYRVDSVFDMLMKKFKLASSRAEMQHLVEEALEVVGLRPDEILGKYPHQLSGGQRQRIMIARAFLLKPRLIVADEPVSMIDASLQVRILDILTRLKQEFGISLLYITHDLSTAYQISDDLYILYAGSMMECGDIQSVIAKPCHPYTQLLVRSIPVPDPSIRWESRIGRDDEAASVATRGCKFYGRCPKGMEVCAESVPPYYEVYAGHYSACHLHRGEAAMVLHKELNDDINGSTT